MRRICLVFQFLILSAILNSLSAQPLPDRIRLNQVGFYPKGEKRAVVLNEKSTSFSIRSVSGKVVLKGRLQAPITNQHSGKISKVADFTSMHIPGKYFIEVDGLGRSAAFEIKESVHKEVTRAALRGFYYQRASTELPEKFAGKWARASGHADDKVLIHASAASAGRPENMVISSPRGWYDAGDYNKYIVNSGITMGTLFSLYEDFPGYFETFNSNIPESNNSVPDLLDEALWNLRWMFTMQDPGDGGVYHKLTNPRFDGMVMPDACKNPRYVVQKNTIATLDFVAVMAQAGRIFKNFEQELPGLADSCTVAAVKGWEWAVKNPKVFYNQDEMNKTFDPDVVTGAYGDRNESDEWIWASAEMYALTGKEDYLKKVSLETDKPFALPSWAQVRSLGYYTLVRFGESLKTEGKLIAAVKKNMTDFADELIRDVEKQPYRTVMGKTARDYVWGSSAVAANQGILLVQAFRLSGDKKYLRAAADNLDYLLGRNATGYCFLTGFGSKQIMHPHHRPSVADGIVEPVPGLLSGGPNPGQQDKCTTYTSKFADESFTDDDCSYASNEIAINWNAPMVYLAGALEAIMENNKGK